MLVEGRIGVSSQTPEVLPWSDVQQVKMYTVEYVENAAFARFGLLYPFDRYKYVHTVLYSNWL